MPFLWRARDRRAAGGPCPASRSPCASGRKTCASAPSPCWRPRRTGRSWRPPTSSPRGCSTSATARRWWTSRCSMSWSRTRPSPAARARWAASVLLIVPGDATPPAAVARYGRASVPYSRTTGSRRCPPSSASPEPGTSACRPACVSRSAARCSHSASDRRWPSRSGGSPMPRVARRLFVAPSTVKTHLSAAFQKLGVRSRSRGRSAGARSRGGAVGARPRVPSRLRIDARPARTRPAPGGRRRRRWTAHPRPTSPAES